MTLLAPLAGRSASRHASLTHAQHRHTPTKIQCTYTHQSASALGRQRRKEHVHTILVFSTVDCIILKEGRHRCAIFTFGICFKVTRPLAIQEN